MRVYDQGAFFRVVASATDVYAFARHYPGSGLQGHSISFTFDARNGDLVDTNAHASEDGAGLVALSHDAHAYGRNRLRTRGRKTRDEFAIQGNYGQGWEDVTVEETRAAAREQLRTYRENEPQYSHRIKVRRIQLRQG